MLKNAVSVLRMNKCLLMYTEMIVIYRKVYIEQIYTLCKQKFRVF